MSKRVNISEEQAQQMMAKQNAQMERAEAMNEQKESMLRAFVSGEGRERIKRIEQVKPERAAEVEAMIINGCRSGKFQPPVGDDVVRELLVSVAGGGENKTSKITVLRKNMDDDW